MLRHRFVELCKLKGHFQLNKHLIDWSNDVRDVYVCHNKIEETTTAIHQTFHWLLMMLDNRKNCSNWNPIYDTDDVILVKLSIQLYKIPNLIWLSIMFHFTQTIVKHNYDSVVHVHTQIFNSEYFVVCLIRWALYIEKGKMLDIGFLK